VFKSISQPGIKKKGASGSVLLEVVLALALFLGAATVIMAGIHSSIAAAERLRLQTHASNLAISIMSEMRMHLRPIASIGPEPLPPPFDQWKYQIIVSQSQGNSMDPQALQSVEVVIRHSSENTVRRLCQLFRADDIAASATNGVSDAIQPMGAPL
jgi:hypothetical protein